jgi:hypothetical protein
MSDHRVFSQPSNLVRRGFNLAAALIIGLLLSSSPAPSAAAQGVDDMAAVIAVVERNNAEFDRAFQNWDTTGLDQYLIGEQLDQRREEIDRARQSRSHVYAVLEEFEVLTVTFPSTNQAVVETSETWWANRLSPTVDAVERSYSTQRYELQRINGRWYITVNDILTINE